MAYSLQTTKRKDGSCTYIIFEVNRAKGSKTKLNWKSVEKITPEDAREKGIAEARGYAEERLAYWRGTLAEKAALSGATVTLEIGGRQSEDPGDEVNLGHAAYMHAYHQLGLDRLVNARRQHTGAEYNANVIFQHLVYSRCLWPGSKLGTWGKRNRFGYSAGYSLESVYRCMDGILTWRSDILQQMDRSIREQQGRKGTVVFYDVTNYYFERDEEDGEDGLRARGVSKEHRPEPIVQMGLFMDELGIPITYELFRGNTNDCETLREAMDGSVMDFGRAHRIVVADKGMMSYANILALRKDGNGYVISQSIRKSDPETVAFALDGSGWTDTYDGGGISFRYKERIIPRKAGAHGADGSRHSGTYNERQIIVWSRKYSERAKRQRQEALVKAGRMTGRTSRDGKDSDYGSARYLRKVPVIGGRPAEASCYIYEFDEQRLFEEEALDGYYILCTNVVGPGSDGINEALGPDHAYYDSDGFLVLNHEVPASEIIDIYGGLWKIEETFKVTKTGMLSLRPVYHSLDERIRAHFLICFVSLVLERLIERQLGWKHSAAAMQEMLSGLNALLISGTNIWQTHGYTEDAGEVFRALGIPLSGKLFRQADLRQFFADAKKQ